MDVAVADLISSRDAAALSGLSYRQLTYWTAQGALRPASDHTGSGYPHGWTADEVTIMRLLATAADLVPNVIAGTAKVQILRALADTARAWPEHRWLIVTATPLVGATSDPLAVLAAIETRPLLVIPRP